jgi:hypothetical protein
MEHYNLFGLLVGDEEKKFYYVLTRTDSGKRTIEVSDLDSKARKVLFDENIRNPRGIVVHPAIR